MTTCPSPTPFETLVDLWCGGLPAQAADAVEAHLIGCDDCARASERLGQLVAGLREYIPPVISQAHRQRLEAGGLRLRPTPVEAGIDVDVFFAPDVDLLVHVLKADLTRAERVDIEVLDPEGIARLWLEHVPFDPHRGEVLIACQRHYETSGVVPGGDPRFRLHAVEAGTRRQLGTYFVRHRWR